MFSVILPGRPCITEIVTVSPNQFAFSFPYLPNFSHVVVFILPGHVLPPNTAAAVYVQFPGDAGFKLLGAIGNEKPSAIFKINKPGSSTLGGGDAMMDARGASAANSAGIVNLGISVEPATSIQAQLSTLQSAQSTSTALVRAQPTTKVLAQRIIKNAFNFLSSFAGAAGGQEVVPLKSFQDWWTKFERRIDSDPGFLEREDDN